MSDGRSEHRDGLHRPDRTALSESCGHETARVNVLIGLAVLALLLWRQPQPQRAVQVWSEV
jgi:hypothetical protein